MRKIYPPSFNRVAVFVLYSLLSIAIIALAQEPLSNNYCEGVRLEEISKLQKLEKIGYVPPDINTHTIKWNFYNFINVIVSNTSLPTETSKQIDGLVDARDESSSSTKILLSIRNYDLAKFPNVNELVEIIRQHNLGGVDIEHPGRRGNICPQGPQGPPNFANYIKTMRTTMDQQQPKKILMLTVGGDINGLNTNAFNNEFVNNVDYLNVETHHYSLYQNLKNQFQNRPYLSYPNAPYNMVFPGGFQSGYENWKNFGFKKIIMSIDFGNTIQVVSSQTIAPMVSFFTPLTPNSNLPANIVGKLVEINVPCGNSINLYSWPWRDLSSVLDSSKNYCETNSNDWTRKFDTNSSTPWLYKSYESNGASGFYYVSYEDLGSLSIKLQYILKNPISGISISDVRHDDDNGTLLNYIRGFGIQPPSTPTATNPANPTNSGNPSSSNLPNAESTNKPNPGVIAAGVLGSLVGLLIVVASCVRYRQRSHLKSKDVGAIPKGPIGTHITSKNAEPSPNRFASPTTVIPVASGYVTAMFDFLGKEENDLSFKKGDKIEILERGDGPNDWWVGRVNGAVGEFPGNYVKET